VAKSVSRKNASLSRAEMRVGLNLGMSKMGNFSASNSASHSAFSVRIPLYFPLFRYFSSKKLVIG